MASPTDYPYSDIVYITDVFGGETFQASGVLISPDEVLTASHVVYQAGVGAGTDITVEPGYQYGASAFGTFSARNIHYFPIDDTFGLIANQVSQTDYAVIHLSKPVPGAGTMALGADYGGGNVHVGGYPLLSFGGQLSITENVTKDPTYSLLDGTPTGSGSSGGPLWVSQNGGQTVVGLVSTVSLTTGYNVQLTTGDVQTIQGWVAQDDFIDPLVDPAFYLQRNADVAGSPYSPAYHFDTFGWHDGRDPNAYFSTRGYLGANPGVKAAGVDPLTQYDQTGWKQGLDPSANFDTTLYLLHNPDVARSGIDPLLQFLVDGQAEHRAAYAAIGPASTIVGGFDPEYYLLANPDVAASGQDALTHYDTFGWHEGRNPNSVFNTSAYLAAYQDVMRSGINPLVHFDVFGWKEGRNPSASFDTRGYLAANADVAATGRDPLEHYLQYGVYEGRPAIPAAKFG